MLKIITNLIFLVIYVKNNIIANIKASINQKKIHQLGTNKCKEYCFRLNNLPGTRLNISHNKKEKYFQAWGRNLSYTPDLDL